MPKFICYTSPLRPPTIPHLSACLLLTCHASSPAILPHLPYFLTCHACSPAMLAVDVQHQEQHLVAHLHLRSDAMTKRDPLAMIQSLPLHLRITATY